MNLGDAHVLIRITERGHYTIAVTWNEIYGGEITVKQWEHKYVIKNHDVPPIEKLATLLALASHDIPQ